MENEPEQTITNPQLKIAKPNSSIRQKMRAGLLLTAIVAGSATAGYFSHSLLAPDYQIVSEAHQLYVVGGQIKQPLFVNDEVAVLGDLDYALSGIVNQHGDSALNTMITYGLSDKNALKEKTRAEVMEFAKSTMLSEKKYTIPLLESALDALPVEHYNASTRELLTSKFSILAEQQPSVFDNMGPEFKSYAAEQTAQGFVDEVKKDMAHFWDKLKGSTDTTMVSVPSNFEKLKAGYESLKQKLGGD